MHLSKIKMVNDLLGIKPKLDYKNLDKQPKNIQLEALKIDGNAIRYIKNPSHLFKMTALKSSCGKCFQYIKNPSEELQLAAAKISSSHAFKYMKNPSEKVILNGLLYCTEATIRYCENIPKDLLIKAINSDYEIIQYIKNPSEELQLAAVNCGANAINFIKNPTNAVKLAAIKKDYYITYSLYDLSDEMILCAIKQEPSLFCSIKERQKISKAIRDEVLKLAPESINWVNNPTKEEIKNAFSRDTESVSHWLLLKQPIYFLKKLQEIKTLKEILN